MSGTSALTATDAPPADLFDIGIELGAKVKLYSLYDAIYTREVVHEADPFMDNSKIAIEGAYALEVGAELKIPLTGWILPNVPRKFERTFECCRVSLSDLWLQGKLDVRTNTTGSSPLAEHTFTEQGTHLVQVRVKDSAGITAVAGATVSVGGNWSHTYGTGGYDHFTGVAAAPDGSIWAAGYIYDPFGEGPANEALLVRFGADGELLDEIFWAASSGDPSTAMSR